MDRHTLLRRSPHETCRWLPGFGRIWHNQNLRLCTRAVLPYDQRLGQLARLSATARNGIKQQITLMTARMRPITQDPSVWGQPAPMGTTHSSTDPQGTRVVPCEFLIAAMAQRPDLTHHHKAVDRQTARANPKHCARKVPARASE